MGIMEQGTQVELGSNLIDDTASFPSEKIKIEFQNEIVPTSEYLFDSLKNPSNDSLSIARELAGKLEMTDFYRDNPSQARELVKILDIAKEYGNTMRTPSGLDETQSSTLAHCLRIPIVLLKGLGVTAESNNYELKHKFNIYGILHDALDQHSGAPVDDQVKDKILNVLGKEEYPKFKKIHFLMDRIEELGEMMHAVEDLKGIDDDKRDFDRAKKAVESLKSNFKDTDEDSEDEDFKELFELYEKRVVFANSSETIEDLENIEKKISDKSKLLFFNKLPEMIAVNNGDDNLGMIAFMIYVANLIDGLRFPKKKKEDEDDIVVNPLAGIDMGVGYDSCYVSANTIQDAFELKMMLMVLEATGIKPITEAKRIANAYTHHPDNGMPFSLFNQTLENTYNKAKDESDDELLNFLNGINDSINKQKKEDSGFNPMANFIKAYNQLAPRFEAAMEHAQKEVTEEQIVTLLTTMYQDMDVEDIPHFKIYEPKEYDRLLEDGELPEGAIKFESRFKGIGSAIEKVYKSAVKLHRNHPELRKLDFFSQEWCEMAIPLLPDLIGMKLVVNGLEKIYADPEKQEEEDHENRKKLLSVMRKLAGGILSTQGVSGFRDYRYSDYGIKRNSSEKTYKREFYNKQGEDTGKGEVMVYGQAVAEMFPKGNHNKEEQDKFNHMVLAFKILGIPGEVFIISAEEDYRQIFEEPSHMRYKISKFVKVIIGDLKNFSEYQKKIHQQWKAIA